MVYFSREIRYAALAFRIVLRTSSRILRDYNGLIELVVFRNSLHRLMITCRPNQELG